MANVGKKNITQSIAVAVGSPVTVEAAEFSIPYPLTVKARPGVGGTMFVEYRIDPTDDFSAWPAGTVSADTVYTLNGPVEALKFTAAVVDGTVRLAQ
jgi:hypothetical protein